MDRFTAFWHTLWPNTYSPAVTPPLWMTGNNITL